ncbi:MAG TPA: hypothetical protein VJM14_15555 [Burkholderiales bacterium]|nr:hypothetical protein [Burkholderiales bacterium]
MAEIGVLALSTAFAAGAVSFLSPCVLPLVPGYPDRVSRDATKHAKSYGHGAT